jgi:type II secretory pathway component PulF
MPEMPFLKKLFFKYELKGEVEKSGRTYYKYTKVPRFSKRKVKRALLYAIVLALAFLAFVVLDTFLTAAAARKYKKKVVLLQKEADYVQDLRSA